VRREPLLFAAIAVLLVLFRSFVPTFYEGFYFDSDQAIVGLMARHISTFHDFPLYYYGLNYLLGVQSWIIAPFFWIFRSSVAVMRLPLIALNAAVGVGLIAAFTRFLGLRPALAFVATLPFLVPTPAVSSQLLETAGASIEPFVYILLLWYLRERPFVFGLLLAVGFMHREFTIFAVPALVLAQITSGRPAATRAVVMAGSTGTVGPSGGVKRPGWPVVRSVASATAGFALVWLVVDDLKMHLTGGSAALQMASLGGQMCLDPRQLVQNGEALVSQALPAFFGGRAMALSVFRMSTPLVAGSSLVGWMIGAALVLTVMRLAFRSRGSDGDADGGFAVYLACVGLFTAGAYPLSCNVALGAPPLFRYLLLALLLPVGCAATFLQRERSWRLRSVVIGVVLAWSAANLFDNARLVRASAADPPPNERRALTDYLLGHGIRYARAIYWDAYVVDFLSRERVITASADLIRIPEYQKAVDEHADAAVNLTRVPCSGGEQVASWCVQK
jgi:hypothetical protein